MMTKTISLKSGVATYLLFFVVFLYLIGFVGRLVPKSIDSGAEGGLVSSASQLLVA